MVVRFLTLLLASAALVQVNALVQRKCTEVIYGDLTGAERALDAVMQPPGKRRTVISIPHILGCKLHGSLLTVCDLVAPQVEMEPDGSSASVLRVGPTWLPLLIELVTYCEPRVAPTTTSTPASTKQLP